MAEPCDLTPPLRADDACPTCGHRVGSHTLAARTCDVCAVLDELRPLHDRVATLEAEQRRPPTTDGPTT
jgi:hypothetical protein